MKQKLSFVLFVTSIFILIHQMALAQDTVGPVTEFLTENAQVEIGTNWIIEAVISDTTTGGSVLAGAEFFADTMGTPGTGDTLLAKDGIWDSETENVVKIIQLPSEENRTHTFYIHGRDVEGNWGDFDSVTVTTIADDDTIGPTFSDFKPTDIPYQKPFHIVCDIIDHQSGVDSTSPFLMWDDDGTVSQEDGNRINMTLVSPVLINYQTVTPIPAQESTANFVYQIFAYDDDKDREGDQKMGYSPIQMAAVKGNFEKAYCYPNPAPKSEYGNFVYFGYYLREAAEVKVEIYNILGNIIETIGPYQKEKGMHFHENDADVKWDISNIASDIYICKIISESISSGETDFVIQKMAIVK